MFREILSQLNDSSRRVVLLTPNRRLVKRFRALHFDAHDTETASCVQPSLAVSSLQDWVNELWLILGNRQRISSSLAHLLWEQTLQHSNDLSSTRIPSMAKLCLQAHNYLQQWRIDHNELRRYCINQDHDYFLDRMVHFEQLLINQQQLTDSMCINALSDRLSHQSDRIEDTLILCYGFQDPSPSVQHLFSTLKQHTDVETITATKRNRQCQRKSFDQCSEEYQHMAQWALQQKSEGKKRIGCVIPQMNRERESVKNTFDQILGIKNCKYNLSSGQALSDYEMIDSALQAISLNRHTIDVKRINSLLLSPYISGNITDQCFAAQLSEQLLLQGKSSITRSQFCAIISETAKAYPNASLDQRLNEWLALPSVNKISAKKWLNQLINSLNKLGWPGQRGFDSLEHQLYQHWIQVLTQWSQEQPHLDAVTAYEFLHQLKTRCQQHLFQPQSSDESIQVLGALEAAGMDFDALWISGLNEQDWPAAAKPHPLLPYTLQRDFGLPHADAKRETLYCEQLTELLIQSCSEVTVSHTLQIDGRTIGPSPLISTLPTAAPAENLTTQKLQSEQNAITELADWHAPAVSENEQVRGGSSILSQQANCPFQAFARIRLNARPLGELDDTIDALNKGSLVHACLDIIWQQLKSKRTLLQCSEQELNELISNSILQAFDQLDIKLSPLFQHTETYRLTQLLSQWLEIEKQRPDFTVMVTEQRFDYTLSGLNLSLVIDRIDQLESGETLVIDYKTGLQSLHGWMDERLTNPQMPLYVTMPGIDANAISFAEVKRGKYNFRGIGQDGFEHDGIKTVDDIKQCKQNNWTELTYAWKQQLSYLAEEFKQGIASVTPANEGAACLFCELKPLCRIND